MPDTLHCVFEYPDRDMTLLYSASLANSRSRGRVFMGREASNINGRQVDLTHLHIKEWIEWDPANKKIV